MKRSVPVMISASLLTLGLAHGEARADDAGDKLLAQVESAMNRATTHIFTMEAVTSEPGKPDKQSGLSVYIKGEKRLVEFTAPGDMKGTKVLVVSPSEMYAYLPAFGKVRRIASHTTDTAGFGMAYSLDDLGTQKYSGQYSAVAAGGKLTLTPKAGQQTDFGKIEMTIQADNSLPSELKYYGRDGKLVKTETRSGYTCGDGDKRAICTPTTLQMIAHRPGGASLTTTLRRRTWKVNEAISDDTFSKRNVEK